MTKDSSCVLFAANSQTYLTHPYTTSARALDPIAFTEKRSRSAIGTKVKSFLSHSVHVLSQHKRYRLILDSLPRTDMGSDRKGAEGDSAHFRTTGDIELVTHPK